MTSRARVLITAAASVFGAALALVAGATGALANTGYPPPTQPPVVPPTLAAPPPVRGRLAITGGDILQWALIAAALLVMGTLLVLAYRRRAHS